MSKTTKTEKPAKMIRIALLVPTEPALARLNYKKLMTAVKRDGRILTPIQIVKIGMEYVVDHGHHRCRVALDLGWDTVPCQYTKPDKHSLEFMKWVLFKRLDAGMKGFGKMPILPTKKAREDLLNMENQEFHQGDMWNVLKDKLQK